MKFIFYGLSFTIFLFCGFERGVNFTIHAFEWGAKGAANYVSDPKINLYPQKFWVNFKVDFRRVLWELRGLNLLFLSANKMRNPKMQ